MENSLSFSIEPATYADVHALATIATISMAQDRQTQLKTLGGVSYTTVAGWAEGVRWSLKNPKYAFLKAVDSETKEIVGSISLCFYGFDPKDIPHSDPGEEPVLPERDAQQESDARTEADEEAQRAIVKIDEMEGADMQRWQKILMPEGSKCIIITGLSVHPSFRRRGIGNALVNWGTSRADAHGVYMWVHSSEGAYRLYAKTGFDVVGTLDVDLDDYAPFPPKDEGEDAKWGHYLIRYMKRLPRAGETEAPPSQLREP
ncbi:putative GNAT family acetyltransferase [Trichodelitschia bisporula]|uniref:Putative GNAT family acetyltransferase n=1 Tax=Trichodelitschia bisporula TaxID=703511 RepID=A0A6G1I3W2_9PEZI|nr:putative GNAT family acetyltransferase [Trichodelitschia bisporula]